MKTSVNKTKLIAAIDELISGYETSTLTHSFRNCPLCRIYTETCDERTFGYFTVHYIKKLCGYKKVAKELSEKGLTKLKVIQDILDNGNS